MKKDHNLIRSELFQAQEIESMKSTQTRGRSIVCGTCFNGQVEISIRGDGNKTLWVPLNPCEVGELIHQLSASIGCTATITPRNDVLSWREWENTKTEKGVA
jgi:hypothetical protein